ncbi:phosphoribosyl-AMP cyclohydrolase [Erythrobacteraceae bacterium CFH 75059]|uniref:phosphoribosyl-AMP cyclohydrolase n=1 Tax=Qipengyuania thermophila TaxID=2509361 RepID=UPI001020B24D|nr:phosphoribosyl-AMP cyclohydrolase [Qipengyuania thermophila]TCD06964.1 phosphoribosyl-AMP cyclohydrolase [Erythrobacteraceae bacterium CFH 75059]
MLARPLAAVSALSLAALAAFPATAQMQPRPTTVETDRAEVIALYAPITVAEVEAAQKAWGDALVAISTTHDREGHAAARRLAEQVIDSAYAYDMGKVLFKPTLTVAPQTFRTDREGALAYFVGGNSRFAGDTGFALGSWRQYAVENAGIVITGNTAISMGNVTLTNARGEQTTVDKTWGFVRGPDGRLRIMLHHSSLPYRPN